MFTYQAKIGNRTISIKALKSQAERIASNLNTPLKINQYAKELTGVIGVSEDSHVYMSLFTPAGGQIVNPEQYKTDCDLFILSLPDLLTPENVKPYLDKANEIFNKHLPIIDHRKTQAEKAIEQAEIAAIHAEQKAEANQWHQIYCQDKPVTIPAGMMAIYLSMEYDDSNSMVDYFHPHASIGCDMLLAIVNKQHQTEALARRVLSAYPELNKLEWTWKTENYSGGHGNYLQSEYTDHKEKVNAYDGRDEVNTRWTIEFSSWTKEMSAYRDYPGVTIAQPEAQPATPITGATIRRNEAHNGIEVLFPSKPSIETLDTLKSLGFRWSKFQSLWYAHYTEGLYEQVENLIKGGVKV